MGQVWFKYSIYYIDKKNKKEMSFITFGDDDSEQHL